MASEYGWSKRQILDDVYLDDLFKLQISIKRRKVIEWKMQLAIVQNPHISEEDERRALWDNLDSQLNEESDGIEDQPELDVAGMEMLKLKMTNNPRIIVK